MQKRAAPPTWARDFPVLIGGTSTEARIIRTWEAESECLGTELRFAAAEFLSVSGRIEQELSRKILDIEREPPFITSEA